MNASDAELLDAWQHGSADAGEALFVRHYPPLARFFRNKVDPSDVADLIQETFMSSVDARQRVQQGSGFRAYLLTIAYRVYCRHLRERYRGPQQDIEALSIADCGAHPSSVVGHVQQQRLLLEALRAIPIKYQVVLELHYWEEMSTREIAEVIDSPVGTVRSRLQRARGALEAEMARLARSPHILHSTLTRIEDWASSCGQALVESPSKPS